MKIYLVGGAVRDKLLGLPVKERDWVVVGASAEELINKGFIPVGKDFPVFLHPETHEEYALARTERKTAKGYHGFEFYTSPDVTLEDDLRRRDLTINAIAETESGEIIDPFNGQEDLKKGVLRHVSLNFAEDPVRVLRLARFAARFGSFTVASETIKLMKTMVKSGEVDALVSERVWQELRRTLAENYPERFFEVLRNCAALKVIFPEIDALFGVPGPVKWHPEVDTGIHTMMALQSAVKLTADIGIRFAVLTHDFGKAKTPKEILPKHTLHCLKGVEIVNKFCARLRIPHDFKDLALLVTRYHDHYHKVMEFKPSTLLKFLKTLDAFRRPERFKKFLIACEADAKGRKGFENIESPQAGFLEKIYEAAKAVDIKPLIEKYQGAQIADAIYQEQLKAVKKVY